MTDQAAYCMVSVAPIRAEKRDGSEQVSQLLFGEPVNVISIMRGTWMKNTCVF